MSLLILGLVWFVLVAGVISLVGYRYWVKPAAYMDRVGAQTFDHLADYIEDGPDELGVTKLVQSLGEAVPVSPSTVRRLRRRLITAGYRSESAVAVFSGLRVLCAAGLALLSAIGLAITHLLSGQMILALSLLAGLLGYALPNEILLMLIQRRRRILRHSLPDALDLLVVCVESGLGLDQAILDVSKELSITHPQLSDEFSLVTLELKAGKRRSEALRNLADRTGEDEFKKLVSILIQTDRFGTSIAQALRSHAEFMRVKRRQIAEEKANKVGVKLVFPIFFFILPSMFLVTVGPALLELIFEFFPWMKTVQ
ncbi:MAG TPA: type II secretion system F family protein [Bryobacterales bacterium]|jgi:tight adherence protein C|nr:type II secretion system F family protein [Bryobacterales bacterium]